MILSLKGYITKDMIDDGKIYTYTNDVRDVICNKHVENDKEQVNFVVTL